MKGRLTFANSTIGLMPNEAPSFSRCNRGVGVETVPPTEMAIALIRAVWFVLLAMSLQENPALRQKKRRTGHRASDPMRKLVAFYKYVSLALLARSVASYANWSLLGSHVDCALVAMASVQPFLWNTCRTDVAQAGLRASETKAFAFWSRISLLWATTYVLTHGMAFCFEWWAWIVTDGVCPAASIAPWQWTGAHDRIDLSCTGVHPTCRCMLARMGWHWRGPDANLACYMLL